ncbi:Uu.00g125200.m01.CDS01 [Anthostomella pinea]|uniref:Uu.00g125200.m01.CDS01 n=1 Tax=Anthostomella pinea TaxID=933095 RepID=A0AAI8VIE7_9PEZI|nr:Uu.00g125200.m01.CDS01 [Anthostomella pinea]
MAYSILIWPAIAVCLSLITFLALDRSQKDVVLKRCGLVRRPSRPTTPSLEKQPLPKPIASSTSELASTFPPPQRQQLSKMALNMPAGQRKAMGDLSFDQSTFERSLLRLDEDYRTADDSKYNYTGFSVREIKALGDFPGYSTISEVPMPNPYREFDISKAKARPYRPFRWTYHQTMSLTKLETDWWIELESTYKERIAQRQELYAKHGEAVVQWLPGSELVCKELMEMVLQFICARYPHYFVLSEDKTRLENKILGTVSMIKEKHPLLILLDNVPEDFGITLRDPETGYYAFRAGMICSALGWSVGTKIGMKLHEIHQPIPDYKEKMQFSMDRFFSKMPSSKSIQRGSWGLEVDQPLFMSPGDPHESYRSQQDPNLTRSRMHLRVDWQTLRRLPLSGGIVFNFKALFTPIEEFRDEPYVPSLILKVIKEGKENLMKYKNTWHTEHVVVPALEEYEREQKERGLVEEDWEPRTLEESPWFPGWEKKWHAQQGF